MPLTMGNCRARACIPARRPHADTVLSRLTGQIRARRNLVTTGRTWACLMEMYHDDSSSEEALSSLPQCRH